MGAIPVSARMLASAAQMATAPANPCSLIDDTLTTRRSSAVTTKAITNPTAAMPMKLSPKPTRSCISIANASPVSTGDPSSRNTDVE